MNAKQEILDAIAEIENCLDWGLPASGHVVTSRIRAILETHTLEPINEREFDPALCGCARITSDARLYVMEIWTEKKICDCPWPATQSEGERLLKLLGVLGDG